jgi:hypothetical protein
MQNRKEANNSKTMSAYVKTFSSGFLCLALLVLWPAAPGRAQQQPPATPPQTTSSPTAVPQTPPQDQPPPEQNQTRTGIRPTPPALPKIPDVRQAGETGYWIGVMGWFPTQSPEFNKAYKADFTTASKTQMQGKPKFAQGAEAGIALGLHNALRLTYFEARASGNTTNPYDTRVFDQTYPAGTLITTDYRMQNVKLSFDYLTWPYPVESRKFRLKTLWGVHYTSIRNGFDAPQLPLFDVNGAPLVDSSGNPISYATSGTRWFAGPILGIGVAEFGSRHFRFEANASGFAIPHHNAIWDADASANIRYGHIEVRIGGKALHYKTTTQSDFFIKNTMGAAFVGLRYYSQ